MTQNQISYWKYKEDQRHNVASEGENVRHNTAQESETYRHDVVSENVDLLGKYAQQKSAEASYISAKASEKQAQIADYLKDSKAYQAYASGNQSSANAGFTALQSGVYAQYGKKQAKADLVNTYTKSGKDVATSLTGIVDSVVGIVSAKGALNKAAKAITSKGK